MAREKSESKKQMASATGTASAGSQRSGDVVSHALRRRSKRGIAFAARVRRGPACKRASRVATPTDNYDIVASMAAPAAVAVDEALSRESDLAAVAQRLDLGSHACVVVDDTTVIAKGVTSLGDLTDIVSRHPTAKGLRVMTDFRAHLCPTRHEVIRRAIEELAKRAATYCPHCSARGFGDASRQGGLPCRECERPTEQTLATRWACPACGYRETRLEDGSADPRWCDWCNP
jgi:DNA-directed RNA polymerase subunit RPC12/RpoP